ncbi:FAD-binding and (Fe-S)-binding domain-containing protein [Mycobacterium conspicuum]|jgi:FAD/FMN-containing dehydrogenase/Fe-S oxidoreductase|uniref:Dimethylmenaquinone methyltransferase n=1 Tax=Mycobacterium conspicuum TaxID=44010 RepID=A0A1X1TJB8_9MYCO|nr:FAD-binding and (Fe-S)-binding domain-containing protein [Mycobacterium conspicuum]ORV44569.1 dimethylmenaquinone methyltransferase [Mycobacterium conspicuum]BBZ37978.1 dimethylmenaquinone methyltransferase [Mycobacterium conspicuum]
MTANRADRTPKLFDAVAADLRAQVDGEIRFDPGSRAAYSTDASNYRQVPIGVVVPRTPEAGAEAIAVCRRHDLPVLSRGGGTSLAGQCCNAAVVIDWSKYCTRIGSVDTEAGIAVVEPGIKLDVLNDQLQSSGWMVGPKPSTHVSCAIGGMIGNNSCGSSAQAYGKMVDSVRRLEVVTYDGLRMWVGPTDDDQFARILDEGGRRAEIYRGLKAIADGYADDIRSKYPKIPRRVSGYNLDSLLPENNFHVAKALVGSESTLIAVLRAELQLVRIPAADALVVLGFEDIASAADAVPAVLEHNPAALEGLDHRLVELEHSQRLAEKALRQLPDGNAWLMVQLDGDDQDDADHKAKSMIDALRKKLKVDSTVLDDPTRKKEVWAAREAGLGATAYPPNEPETHEGWEDAAVPPDRLGDYLRDFHRLLDRYDYGTSSLYGHFGQGCVHTRIPFVLRTAEGVAKYRSFVEDSARLVVKYGGSLSGEHGDGQSRGELLPIMFGERMVGAFEKTKALFDPHNRMNPGKVVHPYKLDENLRLGVDYRPIELATEFAYPDDDHRFSRAAARCVGVGKCRGHESGVMCPSYRATAEEEHSTRGRARLLFEMVQGDVITDGWRSHAVHDALDLCLACKGCRSDCPVDVDMATYKAEFLFHHYQRRLRPMAHYSMGWIPLWARLATVMPHAVNTVTHTRGLSTLIKKAGGIAAQREMPNFADERFTSWFRNRRPAGTEPSGPSRGPVLLWPDSFVNNFEPEIGQAAVAVLESAGFAVEVPRRTVCCGLTWISTGQLRVAKRVLRRTLTALAPTLRTSTPVVVLEPSCAAVFRSDLPELLYGDEDAHRLSKQTFTLGEFLARKAPEWEPPQISADAVIQQHCHQHAVLDGYSHERQLLADAGLDAEVLDAGCCGLAGNFGFENGHYDVSVACAEDKLLPALRDADADALVLADGFSCRTQIRELAADRRPMHLAQVLAAGLATRSEAQIVDE